MKDNFYVIIESLQLPDDGRTDNPHGLSGERLAQREVVHLDIARDPVSSGDYKVGLFMRQKNRKVGLLRLNLGPIHTDLPKRNL